MWKSSNPVLNSNDAFSQYYGKDMFATRDAQVKANVTTLAGVINKTAILVAIAATAGAIGYSVVATNASILFISNIAAFVISLGAFFILRGKPQAAPVIAPIYAIAEGLFLGALTGLIEHILAQKGLKVVGGVALQAFIITIGTTISMLALYRAGIIRANNTVKSIVYVGGGAVMICYLLSWPLALIFGMDLPLVSFGAALTDSGAMGLLGLGINVLILGIAALTLVMDFAMIEEKVEQEQPKYMEWYCGFALLVTLAWIYYEAVKLVVRLAVLFGNRD
jgi:uncharacterized YccA/Bax inhibitor family protein